MDVEDDKEEGDGPKNDCEVEILFGVEVDLLVGTGAGVLAPPWEKFFQVRHPSKSIRACMQPHSITLCLIYSKRTGYTVISLQTLIPLGGGGGGGGGKESWGRKY